MNLTDVRDKLLAEGSAEQIALFLESQGCKGVPNYSKLCPVATYASRALGKEVTVSTERMSAGRSSMNDEWEVVDYHHSALQEFIRAFDEGRFPQLDDNDYSRTAWGPA